MWPFSPSSFKVATQRKQAERAQALEKEASSSASQGADADSVYLSASGEYRIQIYADRGLCSQY